MATGPELCTKVAVSNKIVPHMRGLRIQDGNLLATNMINTICYKSLPGLAGLDCLVDAETFAKAWVALKSPTLTQTDHVLTIKESAGKSKVDLMLLDKDNYKLEFNKEQTGVEVEPDGLLGAIKRLMPFLKIAGNQIWAIGKFLYVTNGDFIVRTPADCDIPVKDGRHLTITKDFAELLQQVEQKAVKLVFNDDSITVVFERCWLESTRFNPPMPGDLESFYANTDKLEWEALPDEIIQALKHMISLADKKDNISFTPMGISLMQAGKMSWSISHSMPVPLLMASEAIKQVLAVGNTFHFKDTWKVGFKNADLEGFWSGMKAAVKADEEETTDATSDAEFENPFLDESEPPATEEDREPEYAQ